MYGTKHARTRPHSGLFNRTSHATPNTAKYKPALVFKKRYVLRTISYSAGARKKLVCIASPLLFSHMPCTTDLSFLNFVLSIKVLQAHRNIWTRNLAKYYSEIFCPTATLGRVVLFLFMLIPTSTASTSTLRLTEQAEPLFRHQNLAALISKATSGKGANETKWPPKHSSSDV